MKLKKKVEKPVFMNNFLSSETNKIFKKAIKMIFFNFQKLQKTAKYSKIKRSNLY